MRPALADPALVAALLDRLGDGVLTLDAGLTVVEANAAAARLLGAPAPLAGRALDEVLRDSRRLAESRGGGGDWARLVVAPRMTADTLQAQVRAWPLGGGALVVVLTPLLGGRADAMVAFATLDPVTRLLNREAFRGRLERRLAEIRAGAAPVGLACIDIDRFKLVNERLGHQRGDDVLRALVQRLREAAPAAAIIGRVGPDRFAVMADGDIAQVAQAVRRGLAAPLEVPGFRRTVTASIGIATGTTEGADTLLAAAEAAMDAVKADGGDGVRAFNPAQLTASRHQLELEDALRLGLANHELSLRFQPKVEWPGRALLGFEALVRWERPGEGTILPGRFISVAERSGLIIPLGRWVLAEACRQLAEWRSRGLPLVPVAVNVSPQQLLADSLDGLLAPIRRYAVPPDLIEIEITETSLMDHLCQAGEVLERLRAAGIRASIDDFGTGHSSLGALRRLPINTFKIDRSFVEDIGSCQEARDIVATIIAMARTLSLEVVAEGVETREQAVFLHGKGAPVMQGYLFSPPVTVAQAEGWLASA